MARVNRQPGARGDHISAVEEYVDDISFVGPRLFGRRCLVRLPRGPRNPRSSLAHHPINRNSHSRNEIVDQRLCRREDRTETSSATS